MKYVVLQFGLYIINMKSLWTILVQDSVSVERLVEFFAFEEITIAAIGQNLFYCLKEFNWIPFMQINNMMTGQGTCRWS